MRLRLRLYLSTEQSSWLWDHWGDSRVGKWVIIHLIEYPTQWLHNMIVEQVWRW